MSQTMNEDPVLRKSLMKWQWVGAVVFFLLAAAFPVYKVVESTRRSDALASQQAVLVSTGRQLWSLNCAQCHGASGQGVSAPALNSQEFLKSVADEQMHGIIAGGIPGSPMPAWWNEYGGPLTDEQIAAIVAFVRSWEKTAPSVPNWRSPSPSPAAGAGG